jgi:hypothetical protein
MLIRQELRHAGSNEESWGDAQAAYPPGVVGMESGQEKGTGGRDPWIRTGIGV